jgi:hypothetical protein
LQLFVYIRGSKDTTLNVHPEQISGWKARAT